MFQPRHEFFRKTNPWRELEFLEKELNNFFGGGAKAARPKSFFPVNILAGEHEVVARAELPGLAPSDINATVLNNALSISVARKPEELGENESCHHRERSYGEMERVIDLPVDVEADQVKADYVNGILTVRLPRAEASKPRQIPLDAS